MQSVAADRSWLRPALVGVGLVTLARVVLLWLNRTDLFVDEAQYWLWGQELAFGYYSKPPLIGWVIRLATEVGTNSPFWVRVPAPLFHAATALILGAIAARLYDSRAAILVSLGFVTLPMVAVGSLLISTDTIMFPFLAASLFFYLRVLGEGATGAAILCGVMLGLAFLSKYAAIYFAICAVVAIPLARPSLSRAAVIIVAFLVTAAPNIAWNIANGLTTVQHTLDNVDWVRDPAARVGLNWAGLAEFAGAQFAVFGPVLFGGLLIVVTQWRRIATKQRVMLTFALPILIIVLIQSLLSGAYANWAAAAYLAASLVVLPWLARPWLIASFAINGAFCVLLPVATTAPEVLKLNGQPLLNRYLGRAETSEVILSYANGLESKTIVATDRDVLADLFYTGRNHPANVFAMPAHGRAPHHYAQRYPFQGGDGEVLLVLRSGQIPLCAASIGVAEIAPKSGAYRNHPLSLYRTPASCILRSPQTD